MKNIAYFFNIVLVQPTRYASILPKNQVTSLALLRRLLNLLTIQTSDILYLFELHPLNLTSLLKLELIIMAQLAGVVDPTTGSLNMTYI